VRRVLSECRKKNKDGIYVLSLWKDKFSKEILRKKECGKEKDQVEV
jgi:hypothetical protein